MKTKSTKTALITALISLLLCVSMLMGTTFAWFTDNVVSTGNVIQTGDLKVDLLAWDAEAADYASIKENSDPVFGGDRWEPGYSDAALLKITNEGSLALQWQMSVIAGAGYDPAAEVDLADVIDVYILPGAAALPADFAEVEANYTAAGTLAEVLANPAVLSGIMLPQGANAADYTLAEGAAYTTGEYTVAIVLHMQETAGNDYQAQTVAGGFNISLIANQLAYEAE